MLSFTFIFVDHAYKTLVGQAHISRKSQRLIHETSRVVCLGVKLREEPLKIWTRYKE